MIMAQQERTAGERYTLERERERAGQGNEGPVDVHFPFSFCFLTFSAACFMMVSFPTLIAWAAIAPSCEAACDEVFFWW